jgi:hypothetical protein
MLRLLSILFIFTAIIISAQAQYLPLSLPPGSGNPNGFHRSDDIQNPMPGQGWTIIYNASDTVPKWTPPISMPFPFWFNKELKATIKVSNTGIVTFDTSIVNIPIDTSVTLPKAGFPNSAIYMLGLSARQNPASIILNSSARNPMIRTRVFGFAPNRQFWISFTGFSFLHADSNYASLCNWSIMLEESSNFIYVIDHSTFTFKVSPNGIRPDTTNIGLAIGLQVNDTVGVMLGSRIGSQVLNPRLGMQIDLSADDNAYHVFRPKDAIPKYDMSVADIMLGELTAGSIDGIEIPVIVRNNGSDTVKSFRLRMRIDNDSIRDTVYQTTLEPGQQAEYRTTLWNPNQSKRYRISAWCDSINGDNPDEFVINDTMSVITAYMVNPPKKRTVIEQFTSTICGDCPRGITAIDTTLKAYPDALHIAYHREDAMSINRADTLANAFEAVSGSIMIDRAIYPGIAPGITIQVPRNSAFVQGKPIIDAVSISHSNPTPADVKIATVFHNPSRTLTCTITSTFEADVFGDFRVNTILVQDTVIGNAEYDQSNTMAGDTLIPIWGNASAKIQDFRHVNIARMFLDDAGIFGVSDSIPFDVQIGKGYTTTFMKVIPPEFNFRSLSAIAFLYEYNPDKTFGKILNAASIPIQSVITSIDETSLKTGMMIFPQPASDIVNLQLQNAQREIRIDIISLLGDTLISQDYHHDGSEQFISRMDISALPSGIYSVRITNGEQMITQYLRVIR